MSDHLFDLDEIPVVPLFKEPRRRKGAQIEDERISHDYPPEWNRCTTCYGKGRMYAILGLKVDEGIEPLAPAEMKCPVCLGMGSVKARVRLEAGHRCVRCKHPYMPKHDAKMLGLEPTPYRWSPCDRECDHGGPFRVKGEVVGDDGKVLFPADAWEIIEGPNERPAHYLDAEDADAAEAEWRILTVHHLDGDKANLAWWNLIALCQRCHLEIQAKVVMERIYPYPHSKWFRPNAAGYYAHVYLGEDLTRTEVAARMDELLGLELDPAYSE